MNRYLIWLAIVLIFGCDAAMAQANLSDPNSSFSGLLQLIQNNANQWNPRLQGYARTLFWSLAVIQFVLTFWPYVFRHDLSEFLAELVRFILIIGFFASLLIYSVPWAEAVINSFRQAGATAAGVGMQLAPGDMFSLGVELAYTVGAAFTLNPAVGLSIAAATVIILLCYTFIAAFMALTLVESYIVINASVLFMAFGGTKFTREYAISMMRYAFSVGAKLFILTLIVGLIMESAREWQAAYQHDNTSMWTMVGLAVVCAYLSKTIPDLIQALINGVSSSGGSVLGGMAAAGMAFGAGAMAALHSTIGSGALGGVGKGVADILKSSGIGPGGSGGGGGSAMNMNGGGPGSGSGSGSGGGGGVRPSPSSRVGGMGVNSSPPPSPASTSASSGNGGSSSSGSQGGSAAATSGSGNSAGSGGNAAAGGVNVAGSAANAVNPGSGISAATMAHMATDGMVRTAGVLASMAVPGMEGSESLSVGPPPVPSAAPDPIAGGAMPESASPGETPGNIIRPDISPVAAAPALDTMSSLRDALNNRGKIS